MKKKKELFFLVLYRIMPKITNNLVRQLLRLLFVVVVRRLYLHQPHQFHFFQSLRHYHRPGQVKSIKKRVTISPWTNFL